MTIETLVLFGVAFFASAITPGPDTMTLLGRSLGGGFLRALPFAIGIALAKLVRFWQRCSASVSLQKTLGLSNPVAITFYVAILPSVINLSAPPLSQWLSRSATLLTMFAIVTVVWAGLGHSFRHVLTSDTSRRFLTKGEGAVLIATGTAIAVRQ